MKEVIIFTMGTRGDIQPYIYLAQALEKVEIHVAIGTHPCWRELIENAGLTFLAIGPNIDIEKEAAVIRGKTKNAILSMLRTMKFVFSIIQESSEAIYEAGKGKDLVIVSHSQMGAVEAEALKIPTINVTLQPEMIPEKLKELTLKEKLIGKVIDSQMVKPYNKIRKHYHLPLIKSADEMMSKRLNLIPISPYVVKPNPYWEIQHKLVGYWYLEDKTYEPESTICDFLKAGEKPIILALGAMSFESQEEKQKLDLFVKAFQKLGKRAIIQGFQKTLVNYELPQSMMAVGSIPHSWLFKQGYCVIHHGGFGTAAASLIYGIPSIPVPHVLDQFGVALQLYKLGVATEPIKADTPSIESIVKAIEDMRVNYEERKTRVMELSNKLKEEDGLKQSVTLIQEVLREK